MFPIFFFVLLLPATLYICTRAAAHLIQWTVHELSGINPSEAEFFFFAYCSSLSTIILTTLSERISV